MEIACRTANEKFLLFLEMVFQTLNPSDVFVDYWHIHLFAEYLLSVEKGEVKRLVVNVPPRTLKSICFSVAWPAWLLGNDPSKRIIVASYSNALSAKHSLDTRDVMQSDWYKNMFPQTVIAKGKNTQRKFCTTQYGFRYATSIGGTLTGEGADVIIMDDPQTPLQAMSNKSRSKVNSWYDQTLSSRLNNRKKGVILLVMQRLHAQDLSYHLLNKGVFSQLKIPIVFDKDFEYEIGGIKIKLDANQVMYGYTEDEMKALRLELGSFAYNAQYLQHPLHLESMLFKANWIKRYQSVPMEGYVVQSWDCASKAGVNNDYSVCSTWRVIGNDFYLVDVLRVRITYVELLKATIARANDYKPKAILIEDKASGQQVLQEVSRMLPEAVIPIRPKKDKITRALAVSPLFEAGRVYLPINGSWLADFEAELFQFPNVNHDDQVDSTTQFLSWVISRCDAPGIRLI